MTKYVRVDSRGNYKYRRRVPANLQPVLGKKEFVKLLGKTDAEAMRNYGSYHRHIEQLLTETRPVSEQADLLEIKASIEAQFAEAQLDPFSSGRSELERIAREDEADRIEQNYPLDPETSHPDPESVSMKDAAMIAALLSGTHAIVAEPTIKNAFALYLAERNEPDPKKRKSQVGRVRRIESELLNIVGQDVPLSKVGRLHARKLRDHLKAKRKSKSANAPFVKVSAVRRNLGIAKAVFNFAIQEYDLSCNNPFLNLDLGRDEDSAIDLKLPLPRQVIVSMYEELGNNQVFLDVWTLLHHTGAQNAEILGLNRDNLFLDSGIPYLEIKPEGLRTVKARSRIRNVPVVGLALDVARRLHESTSSGEYLFPKYAATNKHDSFSAAVMKRLRKYTENPKHTIYSLRHRMKDALREGGSGQRVELAILGHANERSAADQYGSLLRVLREKAQSKANAHLASDFLAVRRSLEAL